MILDGGLILQALAGGELGRKGQAHNYNGKRHIQCFRCRKG